MHKKYFQEKCVAQILLDNVVVCVGGVMASAPDAQDVGIIRLITTATLMSCKNMCQLSIQNDGFKDMPGTHPRHSRLRSATSQDQRILCTGNHGL